MKRLVIAVGLLLLVPCHASAMMQGIAGATRVPSSSYFCANSCTAANADQVCIDSDTTSTPANCGFVDTVGATTAISWTTAHNGTFCCTDKGSYAVQITSKATKATYSTFDMSSGKSYVSVMFYFNIVSESLADTEARTIFSLYQTDNANTSSYYQIVDASGDLKIKATLKQTADIVVTGTATVSTGTWYRLRINFQDELLWQVYLEQCDGTAIETIADKGDVDVSGSSIARYAVLGIHSNATKDTTVQYDNLKIDDDTAITAECAQ